MDWLLEVVKNTVSLMVSFGLIGLLLFAFRESVKRYIEHVFHGREVKQDLDARKIEQVFKTSLPIFQELAELVYRLRNHAKHVVQKGTPLVPEKPLFAECCNLYTERLFKYRGLLDDDIFVRLHDYKHLCQDFYLITDVSERDETLRLNGARFSPEHLAQLRKIVESIDTSYDELVRTLQTKADVRRT